MASETKDSSNKEFSLLDDFDADDADRLTVGDATLDIGLNFLKGAAMNSNITLEQKMSLRAMKAIIDSIANQASIAQPQATDNTAQSTAAVNDLNRSQKLLT